ncbi:MAG: glycosyltransferase family 39 protein [Pseudomonadales bacterium]|nr:glycosyltransferase family 39 protein [Pseudomonadales bacterium]
MKKIADHLSEVSSLHYLVLIIVGGFAFRAFALDWGLPNDNPFHLASFHPDEMFGVISILYLIENPLSTTDYINTKGAGYFNLSAVFVYIAHLLDFISIKNGDIDDISSLQNFYLVARFVNVILSTATIGLTYLVGKSLVDRKHGLLAALFVAISPVLIISAHYVKSDTSESLFILLSLYFAVQAKYNLKFIWCSMFFAGVAGAFKYPGISAVVFGLISALIFVKDIKSALKYILGGVPFVILGFLLVFPLPLFDLEQVATGIYSEFYSKLTSGQNNQHLLNAALYPWYLAKMTGILFIALVFLSSIFNLIHFNRYSLLLLPWFVIYAVIMSGSSLVVARYAVPGIPIASILIAMMLFSAREKYRNIIVVFVVATIVHLISISAVHLRSMNSIDPREAAALWIKENVPHDGYVAITPSHDKDEFFTVPIDPRVHRPVNLMMRSDFNVSNYLKETNFNVIAINESAWKTSTKQQSHLLFWQQLESEWILKAQFFNRPSWIGLPMEGDLPDDLYFLYQGVKIYEKRSLHKR